MATDNQIQYSGEYKLEKLELITLNGNIDLVNNYVQIDLFESIFTNTISGSLTIVDTNNLLLNSPIIGQEYLRLKIKSPGVANADSIDYSENVLSVYKVGQTFDASKGSQVIELSLISPEALTNQRTRVSKSYVTSMNEIVKDVVTNKLYLDSRKNLFLEFSVGDKRMVSPNIHPFSLIDMIASETQATDLNNVTTNDINYHVFYENTKGFHFKSLSYLFSQETQGDFHGGDVGTIERKEKELEDYKRVISFERTGDVDMLQNILSGMLGSTQITHDIYTKSYDRYNFGYFYEYPRIEENPIYSDSLIDYQGRTVGDFSNSKIYLNSRSGDTVNKSFSRGKSDNDQNSEGSASSLTTGLNLLQRRSKFAEMIGTINYNVKVAGHTEMKAGDMINFSVPTVGNDHGKGSENDFVSGKFLIKNLRHTFYRAPQVKHEVAMEITKDSLGIPLPDGDLEQPIKDSGFVAKVSGDDDYGGM